MRTHGRCARVSCAVSDWLAVLPRRMCPLSLLRPEAQRRARAPKWHACCERTVRAGNSAAVCQRDTDTRRRATNPAVRTEVLSSQPGSVTEPPTSGPTALALSMSPVCAVASGRGGCKHSCRRGLLGLLLGSTRTRGRTLLYSQQLPILAGG